VGYFASFEVAEELVPFLIGGCPVLLTGPGRAPAGDERPVLVDDFLGVDGFVAHRGLQVAVPGDELGDVRQHTVEDRVGDEHSPEVVGRVVEWTLTVHELVSQLTWRVLGPLKGRAKSVLDWAGLRGEPPATIEAVARRYFVTPQAVKHRIRRVAAAGAQLPLTDNLLAEVFGPPRPGENPVTHRRCVHLLSIETTNTQN
jgi:hypothetical protein